MITLAAIIERFEADYLAQYRHAILPSHRKALAAMKLCRSSMAPRRLAQCTRCGEQRFAQHVLPRGFRRARNYGFLHPNSQRLIALLRRLVFRQPLSLPTPTPRAQLLCTCYGAAMVIIVRRRILPPTTEPPHVGHEQGLSG
jgi:hypothetical protein